MKLLRILLAGLTSALLAGPARGQGVAAPAVQAYARSFRAHPQLFNGPEYVDYTLRYRQRTGHQWLLTPEMQTGTVHYNGRAFDAVQLNYDVVRDQLVLPQPTSPLLLRLVNEKVRSFDLGDRHFVRLVADSTTAGVLRTGYYELLTEGPVRVLARRAKRQQELLRQGGIDVSFSVVDRLFIHKDGTYFPVRRKGAALRLLADQPGPVKQFVRDHKLRFQKAQFEADLVQLVRYYASLTPGPPGG